MPGEPKKRAVVIDNNPEFIKAVTTILKRRGYEVFTVPRTQDFPLYHENVCRCPHGHTCTNIILANVNLPKGAGLDVVELRRKNGCKVQHIALMSTTWRPDESEQYEKQGYKMLVKPFKMRELNQWLDACESETDPDFRLTDIKTAGAEAPSRQSS